MGPGWRSLGSLLESAGRVSSDLLHVQAAGKTYRRAGRPALVDATLQVAAGRILGIVGESGSGKTTLGRIMAGLLTPDTGGVVFDGIELGTLRGRVRRQLRRHLQYVHQDPAAALDPRMRVSDILQEPLLIHTSDWRQRRLERVERTLAAVGAPNLLDRWPHQLSGGQSRRIGLARTLVLEPKLVVLDEPTAGLDLLVQASLLDLLADLRARLNLTLVLISHDIGVVRSLCDEVAVMQDGQIVEDGPAPQLASSRGQSIPTRPACCLRLSRSWMVRV